VKVLTIKARDLHALYPDDCCQGAHDVVVECDDGKWRYTEDMYDSKDAAEIAVAGFELSGIDDLSYWGVCGKETV
jgi:hypothetical protein